MINKLRISKRISTAMPYINHQLPIINRYTGLYKANTWLGVCLKTPCAVGMGLNVDADW